MTHGAKCFQSAAAGRSYVCNTVQLLCHEWCAAHVLADNRDTFTVATKFGNVFDTKTGDVTVFASLSHLSAGPRPMNVAQPTSVQRHVRKVPQTSQSRHDYC